MALLEGDERSEMPSMSWNSVVKGRTGATPIRPDTDAGDEADGRGDPPPPPSVVLTTTPLTPSALAVAPAIAAPHTPLAPVAEPAPPATPPKSSVPPAPVLASTPTRTPRLAPLSTTAPLPAAAPEAALLPDIVEATPSTAAVSQIPEIVADAVPVIEEPAPAPVAPIPPTQPTQPTQPIQPTQPHQAMRLPAAFAATPSAPPPIVPGKAKQRKQRKDRSGSVARVAFFFLVVGALVSAAVIFGRPYLFPADWDATALEFGEPIEAARGTAFTEPVLLTPQPTEVHRQMVADQLLGDPASNLAMWRSLGLAGPDSTDDATLQTLISEQAPVLYSTGDGQVYYDTSFTRSDRATLISRAMATAALDQEFAFSVDAARRSLDDAALTEANVRQQAALIAQTATSRAPLPNADMAALAFLPAVLDYQLTAPAVFADLLPPVNEVAPNPLANIGSQGPGPLRVPSLAQVPSNSLVVADVAVGTPIVTDRSFWYLTFASHVDSVSAYQLSKQLQSAGLQMVDGPEGRCAVATLATADEANNAALLAGIGAWVAASAPELGATVAALPDSSVQLRSCDPGSAFTSNIRFGVARQLIAWRSVELAVTNLVVAQGGTQADIGAAIARISSSPTAVAVAELPAGTTPADLAAAAQAAATDVVVAGALPDPAATAPGEV